MTTKLRRGDRFEHRRYLRPDENSPLVCVVTAVRQGVIYYRPDYGVHDDGTPWLGSPSYFPADQESRYVGKVQVAASTNSERRQRR